MKVARRKRTPFQKTKLIDEAAGTADIKRAAFDRLVDNGTFVERARSPSPRGVDPVRSPSSSSLRGADGVVWQRRNREVRNVEIDASMSEINRQLIDAAIAPRPGAMALLMVTSTLPSDAAAQTVSQRRGDVVPDAVTTVSCTDDPARRPPGDPAVVQDVASKLVAGRLVGAAAD